MPDFLGVTMWGVLMGYVVLKFSSDGMFRAYATCAADEQVPQAFFGVYQELENLVWPKKFFL